MPLTACAGNLLKRNDSDPPVPYSTPCLTQQGKSRILPPNFVSLYNPFFSSVSRGRLNYSPLPCSMFGIGLPEMIVILAVALIVVGPDKLPELARSLAKGLGELKRTMNQVKQNLNEEGGVLEDVQETVNQVKADLGKETDLIEVRDELQKTAGLIEAGLQDKMSSPLVDQAPESVAEADEDHAPEPLAERPWEQDRKKEPDQGAAGQVDEKVAAETTETGKGNTGSTA